MYGYCNRSEYTTASRRYKRDIPRPASTISRSVPTCLSTTRLTGTIRPTTRRQQTMPIRLARLTDSLNLLALSPDTGLLPEGRSDTLTPVRTRFPGASGRLASSLARIPRRSSNTGQSRRADRQPRVRQSRVAGLSLLTNAETLAGARKADRPRRAVAVDRTVLPFDATLLREADLGAGIALFRPADQPLPTGRRTATQFPFDPTPLLDASRGIRRAGQPLVADQPATSHRRTQLSGPPATRATFSSGDTPRRVPSSGQRSSTYPAIPTPPDWPTSKSAPTATCMSPPSLAGPTRSSPPTPPGRRPVN